VQLRLKTKAIGFLCLLVKLNSDVASRNIVPGRYGLRWKRRSGYYVPVVAVLSFHPNACQESKTRPRTGVQPVIRSKPATNSQSSRYPSSRRDIVDQLRRPATSRHSNIRHPHDVLVAKAETPNSAHFASKWSPIYTDRPVHV
jgi:hypothetical protein